MGIKQFPNFVYVKLTGGIDSIIDFNFLNSLSILLIITLFIKGKGDCMAWCSTDCLLVLVCFIPYKPLLRLPSNIYFGYVDLDALYNV